MTTASEWRSRYDRSVGQRDRVESSLKAAEKDVQRLEGKLSDIDKARALIIEVAKQTQEQLEYHIGEVVSLAISSVFADRPYEFQLEFEEKRGKTEAQLYLTSPAGELLDPLSATGGGVVDVCSFALRVALWNLRRPKLRSTLVLDEPFRFLSRSLHPMASEMLREISTRLGLQIIMVSHSEDLIDGADRVFRMKMAKGKTESAR